jgi:4-hydroxythreonine-4-phosphate dehydrogenase
MEEKKIRVAITHGDTNGVGYEVILKAFEDPAMLELMTPIIYGSSKVATYYAKVLNMDVPFTIIAQASEAEDNRLNLLDCFGEKEIAVSMGEATNESGQAALQALDRAIEDYKNGCFDVLVTAPVNRSNISGFHGHTNYLERKLESQEKGISILMNDDLRVALVTNNLAVKDISESITKQKIIEKVRLFHLALRRDLRISTPRIAVLALNPRCGEDGALGEEEKDIIAPAISELAAEDIQAFGPYAADTFFGRGDYLRFDGVLAMYHDQGMAPFKTLAPEDGVRFTAGLPIVRTAPAHGVHFELAGRNQANANSLRHAIYTAIDALRNRKNYEAPMQNPLPKLYHEKREDGEKVRFRSSETRTAGTSRKPHQAQQQQQATAAESQQQKAENTQQNKDVNQQQ